MCTLSSAFLELFSSFLPVFTAPSFENFICMTVGWILCTGRHTIAGVIRRSLGYYSAKHFSSLYRFFSRAVWTTDGLGKALFGLLLPFLSKYDNVVVIVDDTLSRRTGPHFWGAGMHHDPLLSTYSGGGSSRGRHVALTFGHSWVVLAVWVPVPWKKSGGLSVPVLWRLYRSPKYCQGSEYTKRPELARQLVQIFRGWLPPHLGLTVLGDREYACRTLLRGAPPDTDFIGTMVPDAALFESAPAYSGSGRPRKKGRRLHSPKQLAADKSVPWRKVVVHIYGREVSLLVKEQVAMWYRVLPGKLIRVVVTRDPKGYMKDGAYFCTNTRLPVRHILETFARRWSLEVAFRDMKQELGLGEPQNGWWRRKKGRGRKKAGPQPKGTRGKKAVLHTAPLISCVYGIVVAWYIRYGDVKRDVETARRLAPWYAQKKEPSFADMLNAARRELWDARLLAYPALKRLDQKVSGCLVDWLVAA